MPIEMLSLCRSNCSRGGRNSLITIKHEPQKHFDKSNYKTYGIFSSVGARVMKFNTGTYQIRL